MLGVDHITGGKEAEEEVVVDDGITKELMAEARDLRRELEKREMVYKKRALAAEEVRGLVADLQASVEEAHYEARLAAQAGDQEKSKQLLAVKQERMEEVEGAQPELLQAEALLEEARIALEELTERAINLDDRMKRNMAITRARMAESPMQKSKESKQKEPEEDL